jgi:Tfp pilus assembly protein PilN
MTLNELLNSDLATIGREARRGFDWWIGELRALLPDRLKSWQTGTTPVLAFDGTVLATGDGKSDSRPVVVVSGASVLTREITTPPMSRDDLERMLALNAERYLPLPAGAVLLAMAGRADRSVDGMMLTDIAALPVARAAALAEALRRIAIIPRAVRIGDTSSRPDPRFDFLPAMRAAGLVERADARVRNWWVVVAVLAVLNVATIIWRDTAAVNRLEALTDAQRPAVAIAQRMTTRMRQADAIVQRAVIRRREQSALGVLAATTAAVPDGAWVQSYAWDGLTLRLTGYRARDADVAAALRKSPVFASVKSAQTDSIAEIAAGQPFDLAAQIKRR